MSASVIGRDQLSADETMMPVLNPCRGHPKTGQLWI